MNIIIQHEFHNLAHRDELGSFLTKRGLLGKFVEIGTLHGDYARTILKSWDGHLCCVDPWRNQDRKIYNDQANDQNMEQVWNSVSNGLGRHPRCTLYRMMSSMAVGKFKDLDLSGVYIDGNHAVDYVRTDMATWFPKVKIGGIFSGHDFFTRYDSTGNCDALTSVMEFCEVLKVRPHVTWCSSWWFLKTEELNQRFREASAAGLIGNWVYTDNRRASLVIVLSVARFEWHLAVKWLKWVGALGRRFHDTIPLVIWYSPALTDGEIGELSQAALTGSRPFQLAKADVEELGYFGTPNQMLKGALEYCEKTHPGHDVLWCEADTVPIHEKWAQSILEEYRQCGRPFLGDIIDHTEIPHLTGNAIYHHDWRKIAPSLAALEKEACGWDALCAHEIVPRAHAATTIQQIWRPAPFPQQFSRTKLREGVALFHQCKDGTLIDVLCDQLNIERIAMPAAVAASDYEASKAKAMIEGKTFGPPATLYQPNIEPPGPYLANVEILIVTHAKDIDFLRYCLHSIARFGDGFGPTTIVLPRREQDSFSDLPRWVKVHWFDEISGKGVLHHVLMKCYADKICPSADAIMHIDADCMFSEKVSPWFYAPSHKPMIVREAFSKIGSRNTNRMIWQQNVLRAIGVLPEYDTMVRHPNMYRRSLYARMRAMVEAHTGRRFDDYVLSGRNEFPQSFQEFVTLGAVAMLECADEYTFVDYDWEMDGMTAGIQPGTPYQYIYRLGRDKLVEFWSHGGISNYYRTAEAILAGNPPALLLK